MNKLILRPIISDEDKNIFISEIQEAFQKTYIEEFGEYEKIILPTKDIEESFETKGSEAYIAEIDGERVGGTIIAIDDNTGYLNVKLKDVEDKQKVKDAQILLQTFKLGIESIQETYPDNLKIEYRRCDKWLNWIYNYLLLKRE